MALHKRFAVRALEAQTRLLLMCACSEELVRKACVTDWCLTCVYYSCVFFFGLLSSALFTHILLRFTLFQTSLATSKRDRDARKHEQGKEKSASHFSQSAIRPTDIRSTGSSPTHAGLWSLVFLFSFYLISAFVSHLQRRSRCTKNMNKKRRRLQVTSINRRYARLISDPLALARRMQDYGL